MPPGSSTASTPTPTDTRELPLEGRIARQAHALWEGYGRPDGRDVAIWLEAERQVLGVDARVNEQGSGPVSAPALNSALTPQAPPASTPDGAEVTMARPRSARRAGSGDIPGRRG